MIGVIDFGMGNLGSVMKKLKKIGKDAVVISLPDHIKKCDKFILPGVGHFANAVSQLKKRGIWDALNEEVIKEGKPILGICLGMQLMAVSSEEGDSEGFGWINAKVVRFKVSDTLKFKVPHIGWNTVTKSNHFPLLNDISADTEFYFIHSYHLILDDPGTIIGTTIYEDVFISAIQKGNIFGVQFHPEKSHYEGEQLLRNFINI